MVVLNFLLLLLMQLFNFIVDGLQGNCNDPFCRRQFLYCTRHFLLNLHKLGASIINIYYSIHISLIINSHRRGCESDSSKSSSPPWMALFRQLKSTSSDSASSFIFFMFFISSSTFWNSFKAFCNFLILADSALQPLPISWLFSIMLKRDFSFWLSFLLRFGCSINLTIFSSKSPFRIFILQFHWFFIVLSVLPGKYFEMEDHFFPKAFTHKARIQYSWISHSFLFTPSLKWLCHLSLHCFPVLVFIFDAISAQLQAPFSLMISFSMLSSTALQLVFFIFFASNTLTF